MAQVLKRFVQEAIRTTKQEKIKFIASNRTTTPSPTPITRMSQYLEIELKHKQFFPTPFKQQKNTYNSVVFSNYDIRYSQIQEQNDTICTR